MAKLHNPQWWLTLPSLSSGEVKKKEAGKFGKQGPKESEACSPRRQIPTTAVRLKHLESLNLSQKPIYLFTHGNCMVIHKWYHGFYFKYNNQYMHHPGLRFRGCYRGCWGRWYLKLRDNCSLHNNHNDLRVASAR